MDGFVNDHGWTGGVNGRWGKPQYLALFAAVGNNWKRARELATEVIVWREDKIPPDTIFRSWELDLQEGKVELDERDVHRMKQRLMANEEWSNRASIADARRVKAKLAETFLKRIEDGKEIGEDRVLWKYAADDIGFNTTSTSGAFGTPKPTQQAFQQIVINAGEPPKKLKSPKPKALIAAAREKMVEQAVEAEFHAIGDSDPSDL